MFSFIKSLFVGGCPGGQHYFTKINGVWVCSMCGARG